jgi:hypothetical protein
MSYGHPARRSRGDTDCTARRDEQSIGCDGAGGQDPRPTGAFYASLSDEQKAQFNSMGQQSATPRENATGDRQE